jgi:hypothetical protein
MEPNTLYITISLPTLQPYQPLDPTTYLPLLTTTFDPKTYETSLPSFPSSREEFSWGVYYLDEQRRGTWYTLDRLPQDNDYDEGDTHEGGEAQHHALQTTSIDPETLLFRQNLISAHRVLSLPHHGENLTPYLRWLTTLTAPSTTRSFIWSITIYVKTRTHVLSVLPITDDTAPFDVNGFLTECLGIAYEELTHRLLGRGRAAVCGSEFAVEVILDEEWVREKEEEGRRERERQKGEFERAWPRLTDVYNA